MSCRGTCGTGKEKLADLHKQALPPEASVIVPVYNREERLVASIRSLLEQKGVTLEIILVNDASTDATGRLVDSLAGDYSSIIPVHRLQNGGAHEARLTGLAHASTPWIGFMDADDFFRPNMYSTLLTAAKREDVDVVVCGSDRVDASRKTIKTKLSFRNQQRVEVDILRQFCQLEFGTGSLCNKLFWHEAILPFLDMHLHWRQDINEDMILNLACFNRARAVLLLPDILYEYVLNPQSSSTMIDSASAYVETFRAFALALNVLPDMDEERQMMIVDLYRRQLEFNMYCLTSSEDLAAHEDLLAEAVALINRVDPVALAMLALRLPREKRRPKLPFRVRQHRRSRWKYRLR